MRRLLSSFRFRLILLVLLALLPALGLMFYTAYEEWNLESSRIQEDALRLSRFAASHINHTVEETRVLLQGLPWLKYIHLHQSRPALCNELFAPLLKQYSFYNNFGAADVRGNVFCSALPLKQPFNAADQVWFRRAVKTGEFTVGEYQVDPISGKGEITFGYPVWDDQGNLRAVVFAALDLNWLYRLMSTVQLPAGANLTVVDAHGVILVHYPYQENLAGKKMPGKKINKAIKARRQGVVEETGMDGEDRLYSFTGVGKTDVSGIFVAIGVSKKIAFAEEAQVFSRSLGAMTFIAVLVLAATWLSGKYLLLEPVKTLLQATEKLQQGDLSMRAGLINGPRELQRLAGAFNDMAAALELHEREHHQTEEALRKSEKACRLLSAQLMEAEERERERISLELHDGVLQSLTAIKFRLEYFLQQKEGTIHQKAAKPLTDIIPLVQNAVEEMHKICTDLRPFTLNDLGILATVTWFCREFQKTHPHLLIHQHIGVKEQEIPPLLKSVIYRILQEAFANIKKHSQADRADLSLEKNNHTLELVIKDNGRGFNPEEVLLPEGSTQGMGLAGMKERVESTGGDWQLQSAEGEGTVIRARWKIKE